MNKKDSQEQRTEAEQAKIDAFNRKALHIYAFSCEAEPYKNKLNEVMAKYNIGKHNAKPFLDEDGRISFWIYDDKITPEDYID